MLLLEATQVGAGKMPGKGREAYKVEGIQVDQITHGKSCTQGKTRGTDKN